MVRCVVIVVIGPTSRRYLKQRSQHVSGGVVCQGVRGSPTAQRRRRGGRGVVSRCAFFLFFFIFHDSIFHFFHFFICFLKSLMLPCFSIFHFCYFFRFSNFFIFSFFHFFIFFFIFSPRFFHKNLDFKARFWVIRLFFPDNRGMN